LLSNILLVFTQRKSLHVRFKYFQNSFQCYLIISINSGSSCSLMSGTHPLLKRLREADFISNSLVLPLVPVWRPLPQFKVVGHKYFLSLVDGTHCNCNKDFKCTVASHEVSPINSDFVQLKLSSLVEVSRLGRLTIERYSVMVIFSTFARLSL
jgi:hypothetical protein